MTSFVTSKKPKKISKQRLFTPAPPANDISSVGTIILGGGQGTRLSPLTDSSCKPAINFGGRYRLIDIPISNAINSGCKKIFVLTQFLSSSLHQHIGRTYRFDHFSEGFIELISAEQKPGGSEWYKGTADAVRQNMPYFLDIPAEYFLILSGDQLYRMDFCKMFRFAKETNADLVVATLPINEKDAKRMGVMKIDQKQAISSFYEKPQTKELLDQMRLTPENLEHFPQAKEEKREFLGSMGIYLIKKTALIELLKKDPREDFGKHIIPTAVAEGRAHAFLHDGYWEDIGTIASFYEANIALTQAVPPFNCYDETFPIFSDFSHLPGAKISDTQIYDSILCEGSIIEAEEVTHTILGPRSIVKKGTLIRNSYIMGNSSYTAPATATHIPQEFSIGENCIIKKAIIDRQVKIDDHVHLVNKNNLENYDGDNVYIRDGIIIVTRGAYLPKGFVL